MKLRNNFFLLFIMASLLFSCNKKHKYKYVEHVPKTYIDLAGKGNIREQKEKIFYAENDSAAYVKAYEMYAVALNIYSFYDLEFENIDFELYRDDIAIQRTISFVGKDSIEGILLSKYFSKKDSLAKTLDAQALKELDGIKRKMSYPAGYHTINALGRIHSDTSTFVQLRCGLYINRNGVLGFLGEDRSDYRRPIDTYLTTIYYADLSDTINGGLKEMRYVVDTATFEVLGSFYFRDKRYIYDFHPMSDGGTIAINREADIKTFRLLESEYYAKDKRHCYYRGNVIEGADWKSFRLLDTSYSRQIAYDKNGYYNRGDKMNKVDVLEQKLDSIRRNHHIK